jgi:hypothetical protein
MLGAVVMLATGWPRRAVWWPTETLRSHHRVSSWEVTAGRTSSISCLN